MCAEKRRSSIAAGETLLSVVWKKDVRLLFENSAGREGQFSYGVLGHGWNAYWCQRRRVEGGRWLECGES